jgi:2-dehydro-3-deoxygluconokinase
MDFVPPDKMDAESKGAASGAKGGGAPEIGGGRVVGLGESLLRLSTPGHERLEQAGNLRVHVGGAEMNALIGLANLGVEATWITRLADNPLGRRIAAHATAYGVRTVIDWDPAARAPLYFVEHGAEPRPSEVLYDRSETAMRSLGPETFDWPALLEGASVALCSGITCALGEGPAKAVQTFLANARDGGVRTVFDINHRSRMWTWEQALPVLCEVLPSVDVLLASEHDLAELLGSPVEDGSAAARELIDRHRHEVVLLRQTVRLSSSRVAVSARAVTADDVLESAVYEADVVDAFGAGDAAQAAFVATLLGTGNLSSAIDRAAWACAFQHTVPGDAWQVRASDLEQGGQSGRILR